jgi:membrane-bound ClpP family serine protease
VIDDIFGLAFDVVLDFVPNTVWKVLFLLGGIVLLVLGMTMFNESRQIGAASMLVGTFLSVGSLVSLARD